MLLHSFKRLSPSPFSVVINHVICKFRHARGRPSHFDYLGDLIFLQVEGWRGGYEGEANSIY